jgi:hypothetical protein
MLNRTVCCHLKLKCLSLLIWVDGIYCRSPESTIPRSCSEFSYEVHASKLPPSFSSEQKRYSVIRLCKVLTPPDSRYWLDYQTWTMWDRELVPMSQRIYAIRNNMRKGIGSYGLINTSLLLKLFCVIFSYLILTLYVTVPVIGDTTVKSWL